MRLFWLIVWFFIAVLLIGLVVWAGPAILLLGLVGVFGAPAYFRECADNLRETVRVLKS